MSKKEFDGEKVPHFEKMANCNSNCNWSTCIAPLLEDRGHITESIRILVPVDRMTQKCFQITTKRVRRSQQFQLRQ